MHPAMCYRPSAACLSAAQWQGSMANVCTCCTRRPDDEMHRPVVEPPTSTTTRAQQQVLFKVATPHGPAKCWRPDSHPSDFGNQQSTLPTNPPAQRQAVHPSLPAAVLACRPAAAPSAHAAPSSWTQSGTCTEGGGWGAIHKQHRRCTR
jgi:hypothetical protein